MCAVVKMVLWQLGKWSFFNQSLAKQRLYRRKRSGVIYSQRWVLVGAAGSRNR